MSRDPWPYPLRQEHFEVNLFGAPPREMDAFMALSWTGQQPETMHISERAYHILCPMARLRHMAMDEIAATLIDLLKLRVMQ